jgi:hypothetical protein
MIDVRRVLACGAALSAAVALAACGGKPPATGGAAAHDDHAGHDHGDEHAGHDHGDDHADEHHGEGRSLGSATIGGHTVTVSLAGEVEPGGVAHVEIAVAGGPARPTAVRAWVGGEEARGSVKALAEHKTHGYHAHVEVPAQHAEGSALWIEVESAAGEVARGRFEIE